MWDVEAGSVWYDASLLHFHLHRLTTPPSYCPIRSPLYCSVRHPICAADQPNQRRLWEALRGLQDLREGEPAAIGQVQRAVPTGNQRFLTAVEGRRETLTAYHDFFLPSLLSHHLPTVLEVRRKRVCGFTVSTLLLCIHIYIS